MRNKWTRDSTLIEYLTNACVRQRAFCEKIEFIMKDFKLEKAIESYDSFLTTVKNNHGHMVVPDLTQDLIWHSHMQDPKQYRLETTIYLGYVLDHVDDPEIISMNEKKNLLIQNKSSHDSPPTTNTILHPGCSSCSGCSGCNHLTTHNHPHPSNTNGPHPSNTVMDSFDNDKVFDTTILKSDVDHFEDKANIMCSSLISPTCTSYGSTSCTISPCSSCSSCGGGSCGGGD